MVKPVDRSMAFTLHDIPAAMRANGWVVGARLMERWFARGARTMSLDEKRGRVPSPDVETQIVTMRWAMSFARAARARDELLATWNQGSHLQASIGVIEGRVREWRRNHPPGKAPLRFGNLAASARQVDTTCQANFKTVTSGIFSSVDDFYAALGNAQVNLAVSGMVEQVAKGRSRLRIDEVATYLRDTYDFNGDQALGSWGPSGIMRTAFLAPAIPVVAEGAEDDPGQAYWSVSNGSFQEYRRHYHRGGDFVILSDVVRTRLSVPVAIEVAA